MTVRLPLDRGAHDEHQALRLVRERPHLARKDQTFRRHGAVLQQTEHAAGAALIAKYHAAHMADAVDFANPLRRGGRAGRFDRPLGGKRQQQHVDVVRGENRFAFEQLDLAVDPHGRLRVRRQIQSRGTTSNGHPQ